MTFAILRPKKPKKQKKPMVFGKHQQKHCVFLVFVGFLETLGTTLSQESPENQQKPKNTMFLVTFAILRPEKPKKTKNTCFFAVLVKRPGSVHLLGVLWLGEVWGVGCHRQISFHFQFEFN